MYRGNYAEISHYERKVECHSLEKNTGREMICVSNKVQNIYLLETVSSKFLAIESGCCLLFYLDHVSQITDNFSSLCKQNPS